MSPPSAWNSLAQLQQRSRQVIDPVQREEAQGQVIDLRQIDHGKGLCQAGGLLRDVDLGYRNAHLLYPRPWAGMGARAADSLSIILEKEPEDKVALPLTFCPSGACFFGLGMVKSRTSLLRKEQNDCSPSNSGRFERLSLDRP